MRPDGCAAECQERGAPIPDFMVELRRAVGHAPLWLTGVTAVTIRDRNPADCAAREVAVV